MKKNQVLHNFPDFRAKGVSQKADHANRLAPGKDDPGIAWVETRGR